MRLEMRPVMRRVTRRGRLAVLLAVAVLPLSAFASAVHGGARRGSAADQVHLSAYSHMRSHMRGRTTWDSVFNAEQAARGQATYGRTCARCHQPSLGGADESPALTGGTFVSNWNSHSLYELHDRIMSSMPTDTPGTYRRSDVVDVIAYVLSANGFPAGTRELVASDDSLKAIGFVSAKP